MIRKISILVVMILFSACTHTGTENNRCLANGTCSNPGTECDKNINECVECGKLFGACCTDNSCDPQSTCVNGKCTPCGTPGKICCPGDSCFDTFGKVGNVCSEGICEPCGFAGALACAGNKCDKPEMIVFEGRCKYCGTFGVPSCPGNQCSDPNIQIIIDGKCELCGVTDTPCCQGNECKDAADVCGSDQICRDDCGNRGQQCCPGNVCGQGGFCGTDNTCLPCGSHGDITCPENKCNDWFEALDGVCRNSFELNPQTDISICVEYGKELRDWCYWNAAFYKNDISICSLIEWQSMVENCMKGENPANFTIIYR